MEHSFQLEESGCGDRRYGRDHPGNYRVREQSEMDLRRIGALNWSGGGVGGGGEKVVF